MTAAPDIADIRKAAERIRGFVRKTPLLSAAPAREHADLAGGLLLKLECLQVTGSFKARGAINAVLLLPQEQLRPPVWAFKGLARALEHQRSIYSGSSVRKIHGAGLRQLSGAHRQGRAKKDKKEDPHTNNPAENG